MLAVGSKPDQVSLQRGSVEVFPVGYKYDPISWIHVSNLELKTQQIIFHISLLSFDFHHLFYASFFIIQYEELHDTIGFGHRCQCPC